MKKIINITSIIDNRADEMASIYGLADDNKIYYWSIKTLKWELARSNYDELYGEPIEEKEESEYDDFMLNTQSKIFIDLGIKKPSYKDIVNLQSILSEMYNFGFENGRKN